MNSNHVGFGVLGPIEMTVGGTPVSLGSRKQRAVLAMLMINRNRVVASEALIDAVWGERAGQEARASLHTYVSNLRRLLNNAGVDGRTVLAAAPPGYRLSVPDIDCDIGRFVSEKAAGIRAAAVGQFESASRHLSAAVANGVDGYSRTSPSSSSSPRSRPRSPRMKSTCTPLMRKPKSPVDVPIP